MSYIGEFRANARPLIAACIGLGFGFSANSYILSTLAPHMLKDLGWTKAEFAGATGLALLTLIVVPVVGRITDAIGTRRMAAVGVVTYPLSLVAASMMNGPFWQYLALYGFQSFFCVATTSTVFSRLVAGRFTAARGLALSIFASMNALVGAASAPLLNSIALAHGWRSAFQLAAAACFVAGVIALLLMPSERERRAAARAAPKRSTPLYGYLVRQRAFWVLVVAILLCNLPSVLYLSQLNLMLIDRGVTSTGAAAMLSTFAIANIVGRFATGLCLDRFPMRPVAAISMSIPVLGFALLVGGVTDTLTLHLCIFLVGMTFGAEGDLLPYVTVHTFGIEIYSSVMGLFTATIAGGITIGAAILGLTLKSTGHFTLFLAMSGVFVLIGGLMFLLIGGPIEEREALLA